MTHKDWPSFVNVSSCVARALGTSAECIVNDWSEATPGGNILIISSVRDETFLRAERLLDGGARAVLYGTTEGRSNLCGHSIEIARRMPIVAVSDYVRRRLEGISLRVSGTIHHGVELVQQEPDPSMLSQAKRAVGGRKALLTVAANMPRKGIDILLKAYAIVEKAMPDGSFLILHSTASGCVDVDATAKELGLRNFWSTGRFGAMTEEELAALYKVSAIYVQSSLAEGFGLPVLEALRYNRPSVAVDAPPFNEIIQDGRTGILVPCIGTRHGDSGGAIDFEMHLYRPEDMAEAIVGALREPGRIDAMESQIVQDKHRWDSRRLYARFLDYF